MRVFIGMSVHALVSVCVCTVFLKKKNIIGSDSEVESVHQHTLVHLILFLTAEMP